MDDLRFAPKLRDQAIALYVRMVDESTTNDDGVIIWTGIFTNLCREVGIADGSYSKLRNKLVNLRCISFLQRGTGLQPTIIVLHGSPDSVDWSSGNRLTTGPDLATMRQELDDLRRRFGTIDLVLALTEINEENTQLARKIERQRLTIRRLAVKLGVDPKEVEID